MKIPPQALLLACLLPSLALAQDDQRDKQRARDRSDYVLSLSLAPLREMCAAFDQRYAALLDEAVPRWRQARLQSIERGRVETAATLPRGESIDAYEAAAVPAFAAQLQSLPRDRKKPRCEGTLQSLRALD